MQTAELICQLEQTRTYRTLKLYSKYAGMILQVRANNVHELTYICVHCKYIECTYHKYNINI